MEITYRKPTFRDIEKIYTLINDYAAEGKMLARSRNALYEAMRDMIVADYNGEIVGIGGLHIVWEELAEFRSMAVAPNFSRKGIGAQIVNRLIEDGRQYGIKHVFALTYQANFFAAIGFTEVSKDDLPQKVWKDCINCPKFPNCDETAMIKALF